MTKVKLAGLLTGVLAVVALVVPARAAEAEPKAQPYIVLVGVSQYQDPQIKPRPHAEDDVKALYDLFTDKAYLGVASDHIKLLVGKPDEKRKSEPATRENVLKALTWAVEKARRDDLVIFAFVGQGAALADRAVYFASDSTFKNRAKDALAAGDIEHIMDKLKSERFCAFLDVNFKGFDSGKEAALEPSAANLFKEFTGADEETPPSGRVVFLANDGLSQSLDLKEQGLFAKVVLDALKGGADKSGYEPDGLVTVEELTEYLSKELPKLAREHGKTDKEKAQQHFVLGGHSNSFVIGRHPNAGKKAEDRIAALNRLAQDGKITKERAEEGQVLLGRMPKLKAQQELRRYYQQLADAKLDPEAFEKKRTELVEGTKLKRAAALAWAAKIIQGMQVVREGYVKEVNQGEMIAWAVRGLYRRIDEKIPQDIRERLDKAKDLSEAELTALLADVRERLGKREDLDSHKDIDFALQQMLRHLDPYTTYIDPETLSRFKQETDGRFTGIGIQIRKNALNDMLQVVTPIKGSPAYRAGLKAGDTITTITREVDSNGKPLAKPEVISTKGMAISDAVKKILGKPDTKVKLTVQREGVDKPLEFEITRATIEVETVLGTRRGDNDEWDYYIDPANKIGYVRLTQFSRNTARDLDRVLKKLEKQGVKGFILDLRFNPGGLLSSAVEICDMFIDDGLIVSIKPRTGREASYTGETTGSHLNFPMVCLVNGYSASGSEIVAACLQDHRRAIVAGERSYGKGSVQNIQPFEQGELKMTTASFWRPNGKNLNKSSTSGKEEEEWGVSPDSSFLLKLDPKETHLLQEHLHKQEVIERKDASSKEKPTEFTDRQLELALKYLRGQIRTAAQAASKKAG